MGKGIKTRVSAKKGIKAIDKAAVASERMKEAYIRTKDKADHSLYAEDRRAGNYCNLPHRYDYRLLLWDFLFRRGFRHRADHADCCTGDQYRLPGEPG
ncbi:hypothetical protein EC1_06470 [Faecalitalea cylindroides T2-87]|uniref:Uncharacterized protein n=1 Tax=Faecalitalea cylindroides T2-87 TaxID=717960 RepID=D4JDJ5_9FIRM|nr:hypothetical protein EC1_06470 [Faecalitalea cylindroides T2-87]